MTRSKKLSEPATRVKMNINSGPITQSSSLMPNMLGLQSTMYGSNFFNPVAGYPSPYQYGYPSYNYEQLSYPCPSLSPTPQLSPFVLHFITGNITVCFGCKNKYICTLNIKIGASSFLQTLMLLNTSMVMSITIVNQSAFGSVIHV